MTSNEIERLRGDLAMAHNAVRIALIRIDTYRRERDEALAALRALDRRVGAGPDQAAEPAVNGATAPTQEKQHGS